MELQRLGEKYRTDKATFHKYCDFYQQHLPPRTNKLNLLEIGVKDGASLRMWSEWFVNPLSNIVGIDINPPIPHHNEDFIVYQMDATDLVALYGLTKRNHFNIVIDDGSHMTSHQQKTFFYFVADMLPGDIYIIEDIHTSDWPQYRDTEIDTETFVRQLVGRWPIHIFQNPDHPGDSRTMLIKKP